MSAKHLSLAALSNNSRGNSKNYDWDRIAREIRQCVHFEYDESNGLFRPRDCTVPRCSLTPTLEELQTTSKDTDRFSIIFSHQGGNDENGNSKYQIINKIGQGTNGVVYRARCKLTNEIVAIKKILVKRKKSEKQITSLREVKVIQKLQSSHVVGIYEVFFDTTSLDHDTANLVMECGEVDLSVLISSRTDMSTQHIKTLAKHILTGMEAIHRHSVIHRDIKPANLVISKDGILKIADFGTAREMEGRAAGPEYTNGRTTLWYRAPELILGRRRYGPEIDVWSAGCVIAELYKKSPLFMGKEESEQLSKITELCGTVDSKTVAEIDQLPCNRKYILPLSGKRIINKVITNLAKDRYAGAIVDRLLSYRNRLSAKESLREAYFNINPQPARNVRDLVCAYLNKCSEFRRVGRPSNEVPQSFIPCTQYQDRIY